jgi:hypothetical protein
MRINLGDGHVITYPCALPISTESKGYEPADFDRAREIAMADGAGEQIDENTLLEAMPDFTPFLPHE